MLRRLVRVLAIIASTSALLAPRSRSSVRLFDAGTRLYAKTRRQPSPRSSGGGGGFGVSGSAKTKAAAAATEKKGGTKTPPPANYLAETPWPEALENLERWVVDNGGSLGNATLSELEGGGRGIAARGAIARGAPVLMVPRACLITAAMGKATPVGITLLAGGEVWSRGTPSPSSGDGVAARNKDCVPSRDNIATTVREDGTRISPPFGRRYVTTAQPPATRVGGAAAAKAALKLGNAANREPLFLMLFLLTDRRERGARSFFAPYYAALPRAFDGHPLFWSDAELEGLRGSPTRAQVAARRLSLRADYKVGGYGGGGSPAREESSVAPCRGAHRREAPSRDTVPRAPSRTVRATAAVRFAPRAAAADTEAHLRRAPAVRAARERRRLSLGGDLRRVAQLWRDDRRRAHVRARAVRGHGEPPRQATRQHVEVPDQSRRLKPKFNE